MPTDERLRVTVIGARRRADLAVPARAAIAEYTARLLDLCGTEETDGALPPVWSLAPAGVRPYPPSASLMDAGVGDGAVLYLRDFAAGDLDEPTVTDIVELVETATRARPAWTARLGAAVLLIAGLATLVAGLAGYAAIAGPPPVLAPFALAAAIASALLARRATARDWPLPGPAITALALAAVPLLALAPAFLPATRVAPGTLLIGLGCGAVLGAITARLVLPRLITTLTVALCLATLTVTVGLVLVHAGPAEAAAAVALVVLALLEFVPLLSGYLSAAAEPWSGAAPATPATPAEEVDALVGRGRRVLAGLTVLCGAVLVACAVLLAASGGPFAVALAAALGAILLLRAVRITVVPARLAVTVAGAVGLTAVLLLAGRDLAGWLRLPGAAAAAFGPLVVVVVAVALAASGMTGAFRAAGDAALDDDPADEPPGWTGTVAGLLSTLCVPLALGVFGVVGALFDAGAGL
ncbi:EsaB/YukD family protein [Actinoplanes sp. NPDC051851]|uniref:EsaB/YukD family protein n=1 Tax=Actinoplanes sp. NPDC051851 TaxID=3154753 RepID=UPI0034432CD7